MSAGKLLKYVLTGKGFAAAGSLLRQRIGRGHDVIFAAGSQVDLQWVIPAYEETRRRGLACSLAGPALSPPDGSDYIDVPVQLFPMLRPRAIVTATSGLRLQHMPRTARFRVAVPHSLVSLHMVYPAGTFDPYTDVFCCGEHHVAEIAAMNRLAGRTDRRAILVGYGKAERLAETRTENLKTDGDRPHILIGPSWGKGNILETMGDELLARLLAEGYRVTLRPHPSFFIYGDAQLAPIVEKWRGHEAFTLESSVEESRALWTADIMIADYSGFAMEFAFMRERPVLYVDVSPKVLNPGWQALGLTPLELSIRERIGTIAKPDVSAVLEGLSRLGADQSEWSTRIRIERDRVWANFGHFAEACASELTRMLAKTA